MSEKYDEYLQQHKDGVAKSFKWFEQYMPEIFGEEEIRATCEHNCCFAHDQSKNNQDEYEPYDNYFYGNRSYKVVQQFNYAWLRHIHRNPHHWQHWVLINNNPNEGEIILDMPDVYIIEMICDWWSFSWSKGNLTEIFSWYEEHSKYMKLSDYTRKKVNDILDALEEKLKNSTECFVIKE